VAVLGCSARTEECRQEFYVDLSAKSARCKAEQALVMASIVYLVFGNKGAKVVIAMYSGFTHTRDHEAVS